MDDITFTIKGWCEASSFIQLPHFVWLQKLQIHKFHRWSTGQCWFHQLRNSSFDKQRRFCIRWSEASAVWNLVERIVMQCVPWWVPIKKCSAQKPTWAPTVEKIHHKMGIGFLTSPWPFLKPPSEDEAFRVSKTQFVRLTWICFLKPKVSVRSVCVFKPGHPSISCHSIWEVNSVVTWSSFCRSSRLDPLGPPFSWNLWTWQTVDLKITQLSRIRVPGRVWKFPLKTNRCFTIFVGYVSKDPHWFLGFSMALGKPCEMSCHPVGMHAS